MKIRKIHDDVDEVIIFYSPIQQQWVIRQNVGMFRIGDVIIKNEPTDKDLKKTFGDNILITRGYESCSQKALKFILEKIAKISN